MLIRIPFGFSKYHSNKKCEKARFCPKCDIVVKEVKKSIYIVLGLEFQEKDIDKLVLAERISGLSSSIVSDTPNITPYQLLKNNRPAAASKRYKVLYEERTNCGQVSLSYVWNIMKRVRNKYSKIYLKNREI